MPSFRGLTFALGGALRPVPPDRLEAAEAALGCRFPDDYRDFVQVFGPGAFHGGVPRVFGPAYIARRTEEDRARLREYWFWDASPEVWSQARAVESVMCFDSAGGDDVRFHPDDPNTVYVLPRDDERIHRVSGFAEIVLCLTRLYHDGEPDLRMFEPFRDRPDDPASRYD